MPEPIPTLKFERAFWSRGQTYVAGLDEVGRGAWAGPVMAGAIILPRVSRLSALRSLVDVRDSKLLSPAQREELVEPICRTAVAYATGLATCREIEQWGIVPATRLAMQRAVEALAVPPHALLIDALRLPALTLPQNAIIHGDQLSLSIACASILAKVTRDRMMTEMDARIPGYHFARHKGYGTAEHRAALDRLGASCEHRANFAPIKQRQGLDGVGVVEEFKEG
jgi:ribonuclease HII